MDCPECGRSVGSEVAIVLGVLATLGINAGAAFGQLGLYVFLANQFGQILSALLCAAAGVFVVWAITMPVAALLTMWFDIVPPDCKCSCCGGPR